MAATVLVVGPGLYEPRITAMMSDTEIGDMLLLLLRDTRHYRGVRFAVALSARRQYAEALYRALPDDERSEVGKLFDQIHRSVAMTRTAAILATHQAPRATQ